MSTTPKGIENLRLSVAEVINNAPADYENPSDQAFFALYPVPSAQSTKLEFDEKALSSHKLTFTGKATPQVSEIIDDLAKRQTIKLFAMADAILNSKTAFDEGYSKQQFAKAFVASVEQPGAAGGFALFEIARGGIKTHKMRISAGEVTDEGIGHKYADSIYADRKGYLVSAAEFRVGIFKENPLTADEVKAIPFLIGLSSKIYELAGVDHSKHAKSVAKKFADAGLNYESNLITDKNMERIAQKNQRNRSEPSSPSL